MRKVAVVGTGYVGLVTGACLAHLGHHVTCLDIDENKIKDLQKGNLPFFEPDLQPLVEKGQREGNLHFTTEYQVALREASVCFFALPTPSQHDESCNLDYLIDAAKTCAQNLQGPMLFVIKSTVPVGTGETIKQIIEETLLENDLSFSFDVVSNPEFLREGSAVNDCLNPDRVLVGSKNETSIAQMQELYSHYQDRIIKMDIRSAELAKYGANMMLAARISLINDLAGLCEKLDADIDVIAQAIGADERIGSSYLRAGIGFGGSCLPKDVKALRQMAKEHDHPSSILDSILEVNERQRELFFEKISSHFTSLNDKRLTLWGISFKPETDDVREAPSLFIIRQLLNEGAKLQIFDPVVTKEHDPLLSHPNITLFQSPLEAAENAEGLIILTEWQRFEEIDLSHLASIMKEKVIFDGRNQYSLSEMQQHQFHYFCVGKPPIFPMVPA